MKSDIWLLALQLLLLSLLAIGGINAVIPELHRFVVETQGWLTDAEFTQFYALAQAAPGPNMLIVTLIGWQVAGIPGALLATLAICLPPCLLTFAASKAWYRFEHAPWRSVVQIGMAPITVGLLAASAVVLARAADHSWVAVAISLATFALAATTRTSPLWPLLAAAALGAAGLV